ncbi:TRAP transporter small permease [uncultured Sneathiella sp.]|uniref:TRAP transporter small permease n=1 Tax=uncultured Sneathiella sp. TaxID=879315 RepID=UPI002599490B|nr:TRAP transporter small permease [uncultured Sneathiella sp.]
MISFFDKTVTRLVTASTGVGAVILILMMIQVVADVIASNLFKSPIPANSVVVTNYYMVAVVFLPIALAELRDDNITVEIVYQMMSRKVKNWTMYFSWILSLIVCSCLIVSLSQAAIKKMNSGAFVLEQEINFIIWPTYFILPVSFALMALVVVRHMMIGPESVEAEALRRGL